jgi:hypothetical protein
VRGEYIPFALGEESGIEFIVKDLIGSGEAVDRGVNRTF